MTVVRLTLDAPLGVPPRTRAFLERLGFSAVGDRARGLRFGGFVDVEEDRQRAWRTA